METWKRLPIGRKNGTCLHSMISTGKYKKLTFLDFSPGSSNLTIPSVLCAIYLFWNKLYLINAFRGWMKAYERWEHIFSQLATLAETITVNITQFMTKLDFWKHNVVNFLDTYWQRLATASKDCPSHCQTKRKLCTYLKVSFQTQLFSFLKLLKNSIKQFSDRESKFKLQRIWESLFGWVKRQLGCYS